MTDWGNYLRNAIDASDVAGVSKVQQEGLEGEDAWSAHLELFPAVQRVLNPPFINPHLPKMYAVCRDLRPYLASEDMAKLLYLEGAEYARRPKLEIYPGSPPEPRDGATLFSHVQEAIRSRDVKSAALLFDAYLRQHGARELARRLLLLGSGYLVETLGHSLSCTALILREMLARKDQDPWPVLVLLADYFIKGRFDVTPPLKRRNAAAPALSDIMRSTTGASFVDIHHTITLYAIDRVADLLTREEQAHLVARWLEWMGEKEPREAPLEAPKQIAHPGYDTFYRHYAALDAHALLPLVVRLAASPDGRRFLGRFLVKGLCDLYQGGYDPHYVTGLGAALWVTEKYPGHLPLVASALRQYLDFLFRQLGQAQKSGTRAGGGNGQRAG